MPESTSVTQKVLKLARKQGLIRPSDLTKQGLPPDYLWRLEKSGLLIRLDRGLYMRADQDFSSQISLAEVGKRLPDGIICLLSALSFHELTLQIPHQIWVAVHPGRYHAQMENLTLRYVHLSGRSLKEGIEYHQIDGVPLAIYSPAKTIADCFKFRSVLGMETVLQALKMGLQEQRFSLAELTHFAAINRVEKVIRPYLEVLLA
ncbi:transcriptional regulator [bacterium (Candidatus Blackallbacteria) CG17_big_fil_post_rev_8_21_14_2_50_48_46]|uniref:Transcriptional regulator n=1 Tax=bacterium (Candidatus Blackallbacteria) CG17_big_fil_post_rev_8_21_14_2_50_48_46 TaxID=2014261 RepID=A0A2M7G5E1_9BACT|nr:MAG: transcriptional regulator [bacterium (Candidatus Blackallbacteria) CG18_big_fil_WC_8_21_14_2_50_49_26]PIW17107.1 MAG: transcriptional regulator [bacterium (Candidatus Blackallbacteria) CG17_big_fil_post_rev_8_21_14_2_50_48_46]PIW49179.1 MAG: transcriptional regulator [bacterium (Candidatus Blackallbacteria) CG13_big_fil_rev_8_21_14_2_50_49_14]